MAKCKEAMAKYYNKKVKIRKFNTGDIALRKVSQATKDLSQGKLRPAWEGSNYLKSLKNQELPQPWNIKHLKK